MEEHAVFREFLEFLFVLDPEKRPSAEAALAHEFFGAKMRFELGSGEGNTTHSTSASLS